LLRTKTDFYEQAKIELNFNFPFFSFVLFIGFSIFLMLFSVEHSFYTVTFTWIISLAFLFFLKYSKNIRLSSFLLSSTIFIIVVSNLFYNQEILHIGFPYWICTQLLFVVFNLGIYWGIFFAILGGTAFVLYRQYFFFETIELLKLQSTDHLITFIVEIALVSFLLLYLVYLFLLTSRKSEIALKRQNRLLLEKNELIENQNAEKTIMLREIHHRVKNNLQVVNSLLRLQSFEIKDEDSLKAFNLSQQRIHAMALIHERLYQQENFNTAISKNYVEELVKDLIELYRNNQQIELEIEFCDGLINQKNVVPFGLIVNELISNTLKHGISEKGKITILTHKNGDSIIFEYMDSGKGLNGDFRKGFGLELIETLTEQIDGKVTFNNGTEKGIHFIFTF
jgi:two-component system, sensor histidine kinase PdtaS